MWSSVSTGNHAVKVYVGKVTMNGCYETLSSPIDPEREDGHFILAISQSGPIFLLHSLINEYIKHNW